MDAFTNFLANNYVWFLIVSLILIFALIGYLVDRKEIKTGQKIRRKREEVKIVDFSTIDQSKSLNQSITDDGGDLNLDDYSKKAEAKQIDKTIEENKAETQEEVISLNDSSTELNLDENNEVKFENEFQEDVKK